MRYKIKIILQFYSWLILLVLLYPARSVYSIVPHEGIVLADLANIRDNPNTKDSKVIATIDYGKRVTVLDITTTTSVEDALESYLMATTYPWYFVMFNEQSIGWIYGKNIIPGPFNDQLNIIQAGLHTNSVYSSLSFKTEEIEKYYLNMPKWSFLDSYIPDKYDIVIYLYNGSDSTLLNQDILIQIDELSGRLTGNSSIPLNAKWITNIRKYNKILEFIESKGIQKIIIPMISFEQDLIREKQMLPDNWIWKIRCKASVTDSVSPAKETVVDIVP